MALETEIKTQLAQYLQLLEQDVIIHTSLDNTEASHKVAEFINEIAEMSENISVIEKEATRTPSFSLDRADFESGISFAGIPLGHEFTSFVLALLQVSGRAPKIEDGLIAQIKSINQKFNFETYVSLTCHNCPDVVQALNIMSVLNPNISHTMIEGSMFQEEVEAKGILAVPTVLLNGENFSNGRMSIEQIVEMIAEQPNLVNTDELYDVLVVGGGPAGASSAIYAARKGIKTGLIAESFGGQVMETLGIENIIGTKYIEGPQLMAQVEEHVKEYPVDIIKGQQVTNLVKSDNIEITLANGQMLKSKTAILATGARWRNINVPGEQEFKNKGVAYCPHCDGPLFAGKKVAVIGGGNSGIEAAIDLAGIVEYVTVIEFLPELKADLVLQERLKSLNNVDIITNAQTKEITGEKTVNALTYVNRANNKETTIDVQGVFILIGLMPNTEWLNNIDKTKIGELIVNKHGETSLPGVFAAGDCTDSAYKQIIISMGSGATAALGAFDHLIRGRN